MVTKGVTFLFVCLFVFVLSDKHAFTLAEQLQKKKKENGAF